MNKESRVKIEEILSNCINNTLKRIKKDKTYRPFHEALLTKELVNASAFERSFSTSFGQGPVEEISKIVAESNGYNVERQKETMVNVYKGAIDEIERIMSALRSGEKTPNWNQELKKIFAHEKGDTEVRRIISDLWLEKNGVEIFISIKTVKPNLDQTEIAKKDLLLLKSHNRNFQTFFALFYNPGGPIREDYNWTMPSKIFNMKSDESVLIGKDYWDFLGGTGTYEELLIIFTKVGEETRRILTEI